MKLIISLSNTAEFLYGMRIRPFSIGTQPKGHTSFIDNESIPKDILKQFKEPDYRFGILVYPKPLSDRDIDHYSLTDLNIVPMDERWTKFVEFVKTVKANGESFDDLWQNYIHPRGELRSYNPLNDVAPVDFFSLLQKKGYPGRSAGLEKLFNSV